MKVFLILLLTVGVCIAGNPEAEVIAELTNPSKLAGLPNDGERRANERLRKALAQMRDAAIRGRDPSAMVYEARQINQDTGRRGELVAESLIKNYTLALRWSLFTSENLENLRHGKSPVLANGEKIEVDHIVPISLYPEFENEFINLELMPASVHDSKGNKMTEKALELLPLLQSLQSHTAPGSIQAPPPAQAPPKFVYKRQTMETGKPVNLSRYGGENTDLIVRSRDIGFINISVIFNEKMSVKQNRNGEIISVPESFNGQLRKSELPKYPSKEFEGDLYELYTDKTGIKVFYNDSSFTPINHHELIFEIPNG